MEKLSLSLPENTLAQLSAAKESLETILKEALTALYLYGSAVQAGLRPSSDLDLLLVARNPLNATVRERLTKTLLELSAPSGISISGRWSLPSSAQKSSVRRIFPRLMTISSGNGCVRNLKKDITRSHGPIPISRCFSLRPALTPYP